MFLKQSSLRSKWFFLKAYDVFLFLLFILDPLDVTNMTESTDLWKY